MSLRTDVVRVKVKAGALKERQQKICNSLEMLNEYMDHVHTLIKAKDPRGLEMFTDPRAFATWLGEQNDINYTGATLLEEELKEIEAAL